MKGLVIKSTGTSYGVWFPDGTTLDCRVKGNFRIRGIRSTNPVAIGDYVEVVKGDTSAQGDATHWITEVYDRRNYIIRRSTNLSHESHILAANIDLAALMVTINHPKTSTIFIDRFLATCEAYRVHACLIFNKVDLLTDNERQQLSDLRTLYESIGYKTYAISALDTDSEDFKALLNVFAGGVEHPSPDMNPPSLRGLGGVLMGLGGVPMEIGRVSLLSGNSGVGKSTLLNAILGREVTRTGTISTAHNKGMHTTTFSEMYPLSMHNPQWRSDALGDDAARVVMTDTSLPAPSLRGTGGVPWLIDTPGIKGFGVLDMQREEVGHYFREIFRVGRDCRYSDCVHLDEPGCAVCEAVKNGNIAFSRYESYLSMLGDITENKYR